MRLPAGPAWCCPIRACRGILLTRLCVVMISPSPPHDVWGQISPTHALASHMAFTGATATRGSSWGRWPAPWFSSRTSTCPSRAAGVGPPCAPAPSVLHTKAKPVPDCPEERGRLIQQGVTSASSLAVGHGRGATKGDRASVGTQEELDKQADSRCHAPERLPHMWQETSRGYGDRVGGVPRVAL